MIFHAKALEMLTVAYRHLLDIDVENDLEEFRNTFTQSNMPSYQGSKQSLNTSTDRIFGGSGGSGSLPNTPGRGRSTSQLNDPKRSRSNENLKKPTQQTNSTQDVNRNLKSYNSAPHLNNSRNNRSQDLDVEDLTDDSDEY